jgi:hypothetical protein
MERTLRHAGRTGGLRSDIRLGRTPRKLYPNNRSRRLLFKRLRITH